MVNSHDQNPNRSRSASQGSAPSSSPRFKPVVRVWPATPLAKGGSSAVRRHPGSRLGSTEVIGSAFSKSVRRPAAEQPLQRLRASHAAAGVARFAAHPKVGRLRASGLCPSAGTGALASKVRALPNPSVNRSTNGRPPGPVWRYAVHFRQPGPGVLPLAPGYLER